MTRLHTHMHMHVLSHTLIYHGKITFRSISNPFKELSSAYTIGCYPLHKQSTGPCLSP